MAVRAAAREANTAARALARIEEDRRHIELTPVLEVTCADDHGFSSLRLTVRLAGPPGLDRIDTLTAVITGESPRLAERSLPGGPSPEDVKRHIWAPDRFPPGAGPDGFLPDETGRTLEYGLPLIAGQSVVYLLEHTTRPPWSSWNAERPSRSGNGPAAIC